MEEVASVGAPPLQDERQVGLIKCKLKAGNCTLVHFLPVQLFHCARLRRMWPDKMRRRRRRRRGAVRRSEYMTRKITTGIFERGYLQVEP